MEAAYLAMLAPWRSPRDAEQPELVQQLAARAVGVVAQIQVQLVGGGGRPQAQTALPGLQVALQGDGGRIRRHLAQLLADLQLVADELHRRRLAVTEHRLDRLVQLGHARHRQLAQGGQRLAEPHRFDDAGAGNVQPLGAEQVRRVGHPADRAALVVVP